ncbi:DNA internalization-related competence protein ComEC/Rec2 [Mollicutes bacterium LVI A0078]|nr:DNA internalization-related competence protein ComEC/Rec2 [Mollicutes bacterium LVI A0075]WOO90758.1 DNA internalization-related competence protein ComEC/Rec2 [Mollicutes bacterium LVI A0078]
MKYSDYEISFFDRITHVQVSLPKDTDIKYGQCYQIIDGQQIENKYWNPSSFDYRKYAKSKQIFYQGDGREISGVTRVLFRRIKNMRLEFIQNNCENNGQVCQYSNALLFGYNKIDSDIKDKYGQIGIAPLFAISGMHITLIYQVLFGLFARLRVVEEKNRRLCLTLVSIYSVFAGSSVAVNRAIMMLFLRTELKYSTTKSLIIAVLIALLYNPFNILNSGFILSYVITGSIIGLSTNINYRKSPIKISCLCYLLSLPISYSFSYSFNPLAPLAIIIFYPIICFVLIPLSLLTIAFNIKVLSYAFLIIISIINLLVALINLFTINSGHVELWLWLIYLVLISKLIIKFKQRNCLYLCLWFTVISINFVYSPEVTFIDVGQGDSALIQYHFKSYLIDVGDSSSELITALNYFGVSTIDRIFLSHAHKDHYGALEQLSKVKRIRSVYELKNNQVFKQSIGIDKDYHGEYIDVYPYYGSNDNDRELIVKFNYKGYSILFPGDVELESEQYLVDNYCNEINSDILKVPHHGSKTSSSQQLLQCVSPDIAVISSGRNNMYNHPDSEVVSRYLDSGQVYNTKLDGQVSFKITSRGIKKISR